MHYFSIESKNFHEGNMKAVLPVIASIEVPYFKMREIGSNSTSRREEFLTHYFSIETKNFHEGNMEAL